MGAPSVRKRLAAACHSVGISGPRARQRQHTWRDGVVQELAHDGCNASSMELAREYLEAAWRAAERGEADECQRMLHGARSMMRVGNDAAYREETSDCGEPEALAFIVEAIPSSRAPGRVPLGQTLVAYPIGRGGPVTEDWTWMEGLGVVCSGWVVDDGGWREAFDRRWYAIDAVRRWDDRPHAHGRGLPFLDTPSLRDERQLLAESEDTDPAVLVELAGDPREAVCVAVCGNRRAPVEALPSSPPRPTA